MEINKLDIQPAVDAIDEMLTKATPEQKAEFYDALESALHRNLIRFLKRSIVNHQDDLS